MRLRFWPNAQWNLRRMPSVVITRPLAQTVLLAQRISEMGREAVVFPLLEIQALNDPAQLQATLDQLTRYEMVAFVSPNAIDAFFLHLRGKSWPDGLAIAIMGEGSRAALALHGITAENATIVSPADPARTDSETLLANLDLRKLHGKEILIIRGEGGRELLADGLRTAGVRVSQVAAYRRLAPKLTEASHGQLSRLLSSRNDWIVTSSEALRILSQMARQIDPEAGVAKMQQQHLIVPHIRIAETAQMLGFREITLTGSGDERVLAALQSLA